MRSETRKQKQKPADRSRVPGTADIETVNNNELFWRFEALSKRGDKSGEDEKTRQEYKNEIVKRFIAYLYSGNIPEEEDATIEKSDLERDTFDFGNPFAPSAVVSLNFNPYIYGEHFCL